jgi:hypothetical protein
MVGWVSWLVRPTDQGAVWPRGMSLESLATLLSQTRTEKLLAGFALKKISKGRQEPAQTESTYKMESLRPSLALIPNSVFSSPWCCTPSVGQHKAFLAVGTQRWWIKAYSQCFGAHWCRGRVSTWGDRDPLAYITLATEATWLMWNLRGLRMCCPSVCLEGENWHLWVAHNTGSEECAFPTSLENLKLFSKWVCEFLAAVYQNSHSGAPWLRAVVIVRGVAFLPVW